MGEWPTTDVVAEALADPAGGEPLLAGASLVGYACHTFRRAGTPQTPVSLTMQTNGVLLDDDVLPVLGECTSHCWRTSRR